MTREGRSDAGSIREQRDRRSRSSWREGESAKRKREEASGTEREHAAGARRRERGSELVAEFGGLGQSGSRGSRLPGVGWFHGPRGGAPRVIPRFASAGGELVGQRPMEVRFADVRPRW